MPEGPAVTSGAYPRSLAGKTDPYGEGSAGAILGPDPRLDIEPPPSRDRDERADAVIAGSGAGGAVVAKELAEAGLRVVVLEEGGYFTKDDFRGPPLRRFQKVCRDAGTTQIWGRPPIPLPLGRAVGGTTVVNSGTCWRAPDRVLRGWGFDPGELRPFYERVEAICNIRPVPWEVAGRNAEITRDGVRKLGLTGGPLLRNITDCHGSGTCAMGCPTNAKQAMHVSYLPLAQRAGARIFANTRADRVVLRDGRAAGVEATVLDGGARLRVAAPIVVVAAGTIHTPVLLHRSGVRNRRLGRNLTIHPAVGVAGAFAEDVSSWKGTLQPFYVDTLFDSDDVMLETTAAMPAIAAGSLPGVGLTTKEMLPAMRNVASIGLYVSDSSRGRVRVVPGMREPVITYRLGDRDLRALLKGMRLAAEILLAAGAMVALVGLPKLPAVSSSEDLDAITEGDWTPSDVRPTAFHPMGTAAMGEVVDRWGAVHGMHGLWVADGSIFPSCVGVNPQESIMAFATRTAARISGVART